MNDVTVGVLLGLIVGAICAIMGMVVVMWMKG
jgi:hypothetical protein